MNGRYAMVGGGTSVHEDHSFCGRQNLTLEVGDHAGEGLDQSAFSGAVLACEDVDLAGEDRERDVVERACGAEGFGDVAQLDERCGGHWDARVDARATRVVRGATARS